MRQGTSSPDESKWSEAPGDYGLGKPSRHHEVLTIALGKKPQLSLELKPSFLEGRWKLLKLTKLRKRTRLRILGSLQDSQGPSPSF